MRIRFFIVVIIVGTIIIEYVRIKNYYDSREIGQTFQIRTIDINTLKTDPDWNTKTKEKEFFSAKYFEPQLQKITIQSYFNIVDYFFPEKLSNLEIIRFLDDSTNFSEGRAKKGKWDYLINFHGMENKVVLKVWYDIENNCIETIPGLSETKSGLISNKGLVALLKIIDFE